jgi:hypothetical protein
MRIWWKLAFFLPIVSALITPAQARPCEFGFWRTFDTCEAPNGAICQIGSDRKWSCSKPKGRPRSSEPRPGHRVKGSPSVTGSQLPVSNISLVAAAEVRTRISFQAAAEPDCTSMQVTVRILDQPLNGKLEVQEESGFAYFPPPNPRSQCNDKQIWGTALYYTSNPSFRGNDKVEFETFIPNGGYRKTRILINVM